jgi:hypothetical protein
MSDGVVITLSGAGGPPGQSHLRSGAVPPKPGIRPRKGVGVLCGGRTFQKCVTVALIWATGSFPSRLTTSPSRPLSILLCVLVTAANFGDES